MPVHISNLRYDYKKKRKINSNTKLLKEFMNWVSNMHERISRQKTRYTFTVTCVQKKNSFLHFYEHFVLSFFSCILNNEPDSKKNARKKGKDLNGIPQFGTSSHLHQPRKCYSHSLIQMKFCITKIINMKRFRMRWKNKRRPTKMLHKTSYKLNGINENN